MLLSELRNFYVKSWWCCVSEEVTHNNFRLELVSKQKTMYMLLICDTMGCFCDGLFTAATLITTKMKSCQ